MIGLVESRQKSLLSLTMKLCKIAFLSVVAVSMAVAGDLSVGTWKFNSEKSKVRKQEDWKGRMTVIANGPTANSVMTKTGKMEATGPVYGKENLVKYDGAEAAGSTPGVTIINTKVNDREWAQISKRGGKESGKSKTVLSADGNTRTVYVHGTDSKGATFEETRVFDRVK